MTQGGVVEEGMDGRQAGVAGSGAVGTLLLQHGEKAGDVLGVQVGDVKGTRRDAGPIVHVTEEQQERVPIAGDASYKRGQVSSQELSQLAWSQSGDSGTGPLFDLPGYPELHVNCELVSAISVATPYQALTDPSTTEGFPSASRNNSLNAFGWDVREDGMGPSSTVPT